MTESVNDRIAKATGCRFATVSRSLLATGATPTLGATATFRLQKNPW
jgi:hypothetical protein